MVASGGSWMSGSLILTSLISAAIGFGFIRMLIPFSKEWGWVDHPTSRRRHNEPMPITGGVGVVVAWLLSLGTYCALNPVFASTNGRSLTVTSLCAISLLILGLVDDLKGLTPRLKLILEFVIAAFAILGVQEIGDFCREWQARVSWVVWPLTAIWIVGVSNAINLVDGLDGLAGGISLLILGSLTILAYSSGSEGTLSLALLVPLVFPLICFLVRNWSPAKIFMGDNGSLPIGFLLAVTALIGPIHSRSSVQVMSLIFMLGYPILDMGLCVSRRLRQKAPIFKADRNHLHHRLLRMGLTVRQVVAVILSLTAYLQICAFCLIQFSQSQAVQENANLYATSVLFLLAVGFSLFSLLTLLKMTEQSQIAKLSNQQLDTGVRPAKSFGFRKCLVAHIHLQPFYEAGLFEEKQRFERLMASLSLMIESLMTKKDFIYSEKYLLNVVFVDKVPNEKNQELLSRIIKEKLVVFQLLYGVQYSAVELKISFSSQEYLIEDFASLQAAQPISDKPISVEDVARITKTHVAK